MTVANAVLLATRSGASKTDICDRQNSNPQLTPTTLQIQYCYSYSYEILDNKIPEFQGKKITFIAWNVTLKISIFC
jgi:hypothetical protein